MFGSGGSTKSSSSKRLPAQAAGVERRDVGAGDTADEQLGERSRVDLVGETAQRAGQGRSDLLRAARAIEHERTGLGDLERLREQLGEVVNGDPAVAEDPDEHVVLFAGLRRPEDVVEQQSVAVARGQPAELQARPVDDRLAEPADLRVNSERRAHDVGVGIVGGTFVAAAMLAVGTATSRSGNVIPWLPASSEYGLSSG